MRSPDLIGCVNVNVTHLHCHLFCGLRSTLILNEKIFKRIVLFFPAIGVKVPLILHRNTVGRIRKKFLQNGIEPALNRSRWMLPPNPPKLDGYQEAQLIALCCSEPPSGRAHWSLRLLTKELKTRGIVTEISRETVRNR